MHVIFTDANRYCMWVLVDSIPIHPNPSIRSVKYDLNVHRLLKHIALYSSSRIGLFLICLFSLGVNQLVQRVGLSSSFI